MKIPQFVITGKNRLTGLRDQLSRPMCEHEAQERLDRELANRKYQRFQPYTNLKKERYEAVQLTIKFEEE